MAHTPNGTIQIIDINKFALWAFNFLPHNHEISDFLVANRLFDFPEYYNPKKAIKKIILRDFCCRFGKVIFETVNKEDVADSFVWFSKLLDISSSFFNNYQFRGLELETYLYYNY